MKDEIILKAASGDAGARTDVVLGHMNLVYKQAHRLAPKWLFDDAVQEGMVSLINAIDTYDKDKGVPFIAYASICISRSIIAFVNREASSMRRVDLSDTLCDDNTDMDDVLEDILCTELLSRLDEHEREFVEAHFGLGTHERMTFKEMSDVFGVSPQRCHRVVSEAISKLSRMC